MPLTNYRSRSRRPCFTRSPPLPDKKRKCKSRAKARYYGRGLRNHWRIENSLHWQLDVTFVEDANRVQQRNQAENLALLRRLALSLLKRHPGKGSVATKRYEAAL